LICDTGEKECGMECEVESPYQATSVEVSDFRAVLLYLFITQSQNTLTWT